MVFAVCKCLRQRGECNIGCARGTPGAPKTKILPEAAFGFNW